MVRVLGLMAVLGSAAAGVVTKSKAADVNPVDKVIEMLQGLQAQVTEEGEKEAATYNTFACFCKDTTADKTEAIEAGKDAVATLTSSITKLAKDRDELDTRISELEAEISEAQKVMKAAEEQRHAELTEFEVNSADLNSALDSLKGAIEVLKSSKNAPSLVQLKKVQDTVRSAVMIADAMGLGGEKTRKAALAMLQQAPEVPREDYNFKSGDIISTLETLLTNFKATKVTLDAEEVKAIANHEALMQEKTDLVKQKSNAVEEAQKTKAAKQAEIATDTQRLTVATSTLTDDQDYLASLSDMCHNQAVTYDQRSSARQDELAGLTAAIEIITSTVKAKTSGKTVRLMGFKMVKDLARNPAAMEAMEQEAEAVDQQVGPVSFVQRRSLVVRRAAAPNAADEGREAAINLLRTEGAHLKSAVLTALATKIAADPLAKVKTLIQELIERLLAEANSEANQKGWCDKSIADAEQKRTYAAEAVERLNGEMAQLEALRNTLNEEIALLQTEIADLKARQAKAEELRAAEKAENEATVAEAKEGLEAVQEAIDIVKKMFATLGNAKVALVQRKQSPVIEAPPLFKEGEAYTGSQGAATGIVGMMEVIEGDFQRTIETTEKAEEQAEQEHLAFMTETGKSIAQKEAAEEEKTRQRDDAAEELAAATDNFKSQSEILNTAIKELLELQPACVNTGMSYEERVALRKEEMDALKKALCVLDNYHKEDAEC